MSKNLTHISKVLKDKSFAKNKKKSAGKKKPKRKDSTLKYERVNTLLEKFADTNAFQIPKEKKTRKKGAGRPPLMTQEVVAKLEHAFAYDTTVEEACLYAGISKNTYYDFLKIYPEFSNRVEELRQAAILVARRTVLSDVESNPEMALRYLERKNKKEFSVRTEVAHSGEVVNRHSIDPATEEKIRSAMGNFSKKIGDLVKERADKK